MIDQKLRKLLYRDGIDVAQEIDKCAIPIIEEIIEPIDENGKYFIINKNSSQQKRPQYQCRNHVAISYSNVT